MNIEATSMGAIGHRTFTPMSVNVIGRNWRLTSDWNDELADKVVAFLTSTQFEFYTTGTPPSEEAAKKLVSSARERTEAGIPFTRFPVLNPDGEILGEFAVGFDNNPRKIQLAIRIKDLTSEGITEEVLGWCLTQYLPVLHEKNIQFPVFAENEESIPWAEKTVTEWLDLREVTIVATAHPDYTEHNELFQKMGFTKVAEVVKESFAGVHDGRRNVYELAVRTLLNKECAEESAPQDNSDVMASSKETVLSNLLEASKNVIEKEDPLADTTRIETEVFSPQKEESLATPSAEETEVPSPQKEESLATPSAEETQAPSPQKEELLAEFPVKQQEGSSQEPQVASEESIEK